MIFWGLRAKTVSSRDLCWLAAHNLRHTHILTKTGTNMVIQVTTDGEKNTFLSYIVFFYRYNLFHLSQWTPGG